MSETSMAKCIQLETEICRKDHQIMADENTMRDCEATEANFNLWNTLLSGACQPVR